MSEPQIVKLKTAAMLAVMACLLAATGCKQELQTGYGRSRGRQYTSSINGTIVLERMLKSSDRRVDHYRKVSPRWYDYDTIFWIPDDFRAPSQKAIDKAEEWLAADTDKTLVFVARDYDAEIVYWDHLRQTTPASDAEAAKRIERDYADALSRHFARSSGYPDQSCDWYDWNSGSFQRATKISGPLAESIDTDSADIYYGSLPAPGDVIETGKFNDYEVTVLLTADSKPLVYSLSKEEWYGSRIIFVGNGSLVLNYPLTNEINRALSSRLLEEADEIDYDWNDVLIVENQGEIIVSDIDVPDVNSKWSWITKPPLRYVVPNLVFWCMLFCFVYFPIFGRPRRLKRKSTANFQDHIFALAKLVSETKNRENPQAWLDHYRNHSKRHQKSK